MDKEISGLLQPAHFDRIASLWDGELASARSTRFRT
jgi:hypothetical protein